MSRLDVKAIRARADAATAGPWTTWQDGNQFVDPPMKYSNDALRRTVHAVIVRGLPRAWNPWWVGHEDAKTSHKSHGESRFGAEDAAFIAAARTDVPALCSRVEALEAALRDVLPLAESWADGKGRSHPDHDAVTAARAALGDET